MAINPETGFAGKIAPSSPEYPYGEARDVTAPGDGTGTPWVALLLNDIFGLQQALLSLAQVVPSGTPDKVGGSQYLESLQKIFPSIRVDLSTMLNDDTFKVGEYVLIAERTAGQGGGGFWRVVTTASVTPDTYGIVTSIADPLLSFVLEEADDALNPKQFGAIGDGVTDSTGAWSAWAADPRSKMVLPGDYLVSAVVKSYSTPTYVNTENNNHASGYLALESAVDGENNTAYGSSALRKTDGILPLGSDNVGIGHQALTSNEEGYRNVAVGYQSLFSQVGNLVMGNSNSALGYQSLFNNTTGKDNVALGYLAMFFNVEGGGNVSVGYRALWSNVGTTDGDPTYAAIDGSFNVAVGYEAMLSNTFGKSNAAVGWRALFSNTTGTRNTANGQEALRENITGTDNTAVGYKALEACVNGNDNVAIGYEALFTSTGPEKNVAIGREALHVATTAIENVAIGFQALVANTGGDQSAAVGHRALARLTTGANCSALGYQALEFTIAGGSLQALTNCTGLGNGSRASASNQVQLGDSATTTYAYGAVQDRSDERDKADIRDTLLGLDFVNSLRPVDFKWDMRDDYLEKEEYTDEGGKKQTRLVALPKDGSKKRSRYHHGVIAQEVEALGVDFGGLQHHSVGGGEDVYSVGYTELIGPLVKAVQELTAKNAELEKRLSDAGL